MPSNRTRLPSGIAVRTTLVIATSFLCGLALASALFLWHAIHSIDHEPLLFKPLRAADAAAHSALSGDREKAALPQEASGHRSLLSGLRVLVTIASYDFMQLAHLEEVLDGFQDLCYAGSHVDVVIYTTVVYPVALIDMLNDRMRCNDPSPTSGMTVTLILKPASVRLHLVDFHRTLFYDRIDLYDVFVYTEDDIRISPKTIAAYLHETHRVSSLVGPTHASDYNVGIVRYEYNFPENVVITDKTRHATENVTRVYWEHLGKPIFEKAVDKVEHQELSKYYVSMHLHHQGMYMATPDLLRAWKDRPGCKFDEVRNRPGSGSQPSEGTQRVWMSSQMLFGKRHCGVTQLLPVDNFGQLTVLHLPNKNYRRVGKQGRIGGSDNSPKNEFSDGTEVFEPSHPDLLRALELHIEMKRQFPHLKSTNVAGEDGRLRYVGIRMVDTDLNVGSFAKDHRQVAEKRLEAYRAYVGRGGYMIDSDMDIDIDAWRITS
ncbi:hypothetical protein HJC23_012916 [Cyclotella cryptica]|uniref:Glycosyltransferase family 92 protein n=1 Tax=Cyclotella cryptica TaxID=29204 RepID=A0ABD3Q1N2_9STRA